MMTGSRMTSSVMSRECGILSLRRTLMYRQHPTAVLLESNAMFGVMPLTPAYGRDYTSLGALMKDWEAGKDFVTVSGQYCSKRDFKYRELIQVRYNKQREVGEFKNP
jgi:hypothetical protein